VIGPYFFKNETGATVTVNGMRYRAMINDFLWPELEDIDVNDVCFQQNGATCHTSNKTISILQDGFLKEVFTIGHRDLVI
jgi:hypothetical protein